MRDQFDRGMALLFVPLLLVTNVLDRLVTWPFRCRECGSRPDERHDRTCPLFYPENPDAR